MHQRLFSFVPKLLLLVFLFFIFSCKNEKKESAIKTPISYEQNLAKMKEKTTSLLKHLKQYKIKKTDYKRLTCYFSAKEEKNAIALSEELGKSRYAVETGEYTTKKPWLINTKTNYYVKMNEDSVSNWVEKMCKMGHKHKCIMEGWSVSLKE